MKLTVVGCSGSVPGPESPASSYLIQAPYEGRTFSLVLDLGPGAFGALYRYLDPRRGRRLRAQPPAPRPLPRPVRLLRRRPLLPDRALAAAPAATARPARPTGWPGRTTCPARRRRHADAESGHGRALRVLGLATPAVIGPFTVDTARVAHPVEAYAVRVSENVDGGGSLVFSGDTGPCDALVELARGVDLLLVGVGVPGGPGQPAGPAPDRPAGRRGRRGGGGRRGGAHPHPAVARPRPGAGRGDAALRRARLTGRDRGGLGNRVRPVTDRADGRRP